MSPFRRRNKAQDKAILAFLRPNFLATIYGYLLWGTFEYKVKQMNGEGMEEKERNQWLRIESWHLSFQKINNHSSKKMWQ